MKHKIIVIDDEYEDRRESYNRLEDEMSSFDSSFKLHIDFVKNPNQLPLMIQSNHYSGCILDAVLDIKWEGFNITEALRYLGTNIPIAIVSDRWDETNSEEIEEALKKPNCRTFLHWRDINLNGKGEIDYATRSIVCMLADNLKLDTQFNLGLGEPIRILHISDIQTGGFKQKQLKLEANRCADTILTHWDENAPTFVAFTGDVAEHGTPSQYKAAQEWIGYFLDRLGMNNLPARNLLYVPGNHDVNLNIAFGSRIKITINDSNETTSELLKKDVLQPDLIRYAYTPFRDFLKNICDCPLISRGINDHNFAWIESRFRHLGVVFYGINTAQPANALDVPGREVNADALAQIGVELKNVVNSCDNPPPLVVGLGHHCPVSARGDSAVENPNIFEKFFRGSVKTPLFLHGHVHEHDLSYTSNDGLRLVRSCATTLTKRDSSRPDDSLRGFNLLNLERKNHVVDSLSAFSYGWVGNSLKKIKEDAWKRQNDGMFGEALG